MFLSLNTIMFLVGNFKLARSLFAALLASCSVAYHPVILPPPSGSIKVTVHAPAPQGSLGAFCVYPWSRTTTELYLESRLVLSKNLLPLIPIESKYLDANSSFSIAFVYSSGNAGNASLPACPSTPSYISLPVRSSQSAL